MCGIIVVHMLYMVYMFHLRCCVHELLCIYSVCTCCLCNVMSRVLVQIMLYGCCILSVGYRWCYLHVGYVVLCIDDALYMWCCVHVVHVVLCTYGLVFIIIQVVLCASSIVYML